MPGWQALLAASAAFLVLLVHYFVDFTGGRPALSTCCFYRKQPEQLPDGWQWDTYHTHDELVNFMWWINRTYPYVATVYSIGTSAQGRELLAVELRGRRIPYPFWQKKPKVKLVGNIHGNEQATREVLLHFIHHLADSYNRKHRVTQLLDNVNIHILPSMNPDGYTANTRHNANGFDLNRNFPLEAMPYDPPGPASPNDSDSVKSWRATGAGAIQPEVAAVMAWSQQHHFLLSASLHQGALVANYPHDACDTQALLRYCPTQEDPLPRFLAQVYAQNHKVMRLNNNATSGFVNGTVQGAQWYTLLGGMQDWVFFDRQSLELTMELQEVMRPAPQKLPSLWELNLPALMRFTEMGQMGLHGHLVDSETFTPLQGVVSVNLPDYHRPTFITDDGGEFFIMLAPDVLYCLTIRATTKKHSHEYHAIHVTALRMGADKFITGTGPSLLTERHMFFAERVYDSTGNSGQSSRSAGGVQSRHLRQKPRTKHVLLGKAAVGMCSLSGTGTQDSVVAAL